MGAKRFVLGTVLVFIVILVAGLIAGYFYLSPSRPDPVLFSSSQVAASDLPVDLQGRTDAELQARLDELLEQNQGDHPEIWWRPRLGLNDLKTVRLLAKRLGDDRTAVRSLIWIAWEQRFSRDTFEALAAVDTAIDEARRLGLDRELAEGHLVRGELLEKIGLYDWSAIERQRAIDGFAGLEAWDRKAYTITQLANLHGHRRLDFHKAISVYGELDELIGKVEPDRLAPAFALFGYTLMSAGRYPEALERMEQAVRLAEESGSEAYVISQLTGLATLQLELNDPAGESALWEAAGLAGPEVITRGFAEPYHIMAGNCQARGDVERARELLHEALAVLDSRETEVDPAADLYKSIQSNLQADRFTVLEDLGDLCLAEEDYSGALEWYSRAREVSGGSLGLKFAKAYLGLERWDEAWTELEKPQTSNIPGYLGIIDGPDLGTLCLQARVRLGQGDYDGAELLLDEVVTLLPETGTAAGLREDSGIAQLRAELALARDDSKTAREQYLQALSQLIQAGRDCSWNSEYRRGLAGEIHEVAEKYISLLDEVDDRDRINAVRALLDLVDQARELEFAPLPETTDAAVKALQDYRATRCELLNLRGSFDWATGGSQAPNVWEIYTGWRNYDWKYRRELSQQLGRLRREINARIVDLEALAENQLVELKRLDAETWKIVTLTNEVI